MDTVVSSLQRLMPDITFQSAEQLCWSPKSQTIAYRADDTSDDNLWGLLHEAGHASLRHQTFTSDIQLLLLEVAAWDKAKEVAASVSVEIDEEHIQDCLDSYRDWLHQRSTCPRCGIVSFQDAPRSYRCHNCHKTWSVSASRLCRPYRLGADTKKNRPEKIPQAVFQAKSQY